MYIEARFQMNTSQSFKKEAAIFRLKCNGNNFETSENDVSLSLHFDQSRRASNPNLRDLRNVLTSLSGAQENRNVEIQQLPTS